MLFGGQLPRMRTVGSTLLLDSKKMLLENCLDCLKQHMMRKSPEKSPKNRHKICVKEYFSSEKQIRFLTKLNHSDKTVKQPSTSKSSSKRVKELLLHFKDYLNLRI